MQPLANIAKNWRFLTVLLLMPLLAGGVSWLAFAGPGIRLAELHSLLQNAGNAGRVPHDPLGDTHTSLYFMVLAGWRALLGSSPAAVRSLSEVFYLMSIPAMYVAVRAAYGKATGIFAALMASVSPCMQWQGSEATAFSMLAFWSAINLYYFTRIMLGDERERTAWIGYGITAVLGIWTYPLSLVLASFQLLIVFVNRRGNAPFLGLRTRIWGAIMVGMLWIWLGGKMIEVASFDRWLTPLDQEAQAARFSTTFVTLFLGFQGSAVITFIAAAWPLAVLGVFCGLSPASKPSRLTLGLAAVALGPLALLAVASLLITPMPLSQYSAMIVPTLYALVARAVCSCEWPYSFLAGSGLLVVMLLALARQSFQPNLAIKQDYRGLSQYLSSKVGSNDVIIVSSPFVVFPIEYYYNGPARMNTVPAWDRSDARAIPVFDETTMEEEVVKLLNGRNTCWLVLSCDQGYERAIGNFFNRHLQRLYYREFSPGLRLAAFRQVRPIEIEKPRLGPKSALNPLAGFRLYVNPDSPARQQAREWRETRPQDATLLDKIAAHPMAFWLVRNNRSVALDIKKIMSAAGEEKAVPCFVTYFFPERDRGGFSGGGARDAKEYLGWIQAIADSIGDRKAIVILEPDTLGFLLNVPGLEKERRLTLLRKAAHIFGQKRGVISYIDAGHCNWVSPGEMASLLQRVGIGTARGFALNVSNFYPNDEVIAYGNKISKLLNGKPFVIDTSRNGLGATNELFNPPGRALGFPPSVHTGHAHVDAFLWVKNPGESDGTANGGPVAGQWWAEYALGLAERARW